MRIITNNLNVLDIEHYIYICEKSHLSTLLPENVYYIYSYIAYRYTLYISQVYKRYIIGFYLSRFIVRIFIN